MPGLQIYRSNRLEELAALLGDLLRARPLPNLLQRETIVVQSLGMRRWLSLQLAERLGVAMNCAFPFPLGWAHETFRAAFPGMPEQSPFSHEALEWRVLAALPRLLPLPGFEPLARYVEGEMGAMKRYQLAGQLASTFDRGLVFRAEQLLAWADGPTRRGDGSDGWQARLWRELVAPHPETHPPALLRRLEARIAHGNLSLPGVPERVSLFGIGSLPPYFLSLLGAVAKCVEVHFFLLEPTDQYWGDLRLPTVDAPPDASFFPEEANTLLVSMGRPGQAFTRAVQDLEPVLAVEHFVEPVGGTLLRRMQADVFALRQGSEDGSAAEPDDSVQVHCCHGPMREVEILHDHLLHLFETLPGLAPRDILITMPNVELYAPFIEAVFGAPEAEGHRIPFTIADRSARAESSIAHAFLQLLDLHGSRMAAGPVLALLESAPVRRRFGLDEADLPTVRRWVEECLVCWGIDAAHREEVGVGRWGQNTWRAGLERLLLGYALPGDGTQLFHGILPVAEVEGDLAQTLGGFAQFAERLFTMLPRLIDPRPLDDWAQTLRVLLDAFFDDAEDGADEVLRLRRALEELSERVADYPEPLPFEVIRVHLRKLFSDTEGGFGFLAGRATFCSLKPMRSIPFRVICVLGMNLTDFPRREPVLPFDEGQRAGSRRDEDRQLFLETVLSARDVLYLSYCGRSQRDGAERPPSVVVSEVLDYVEAHYGGKPAREALVRHHPLQPFSAAYFTGGDKRLFSYSAENCGAAGARRSRRGARPIFAEGMLPEPEGEWRTVDLAQLSRFFCAPAQYFAQKRLRLHLPEESGALAETEPLALGALTRVQLLGELLESLLRGSTVDDALDLARASGRLPAGWAGTSQYRRLSSDAVAMAAVLAPHLKEPTMPPHTLDLTLGPWRLRGTFRDLRPAAHLRYRAAAMKPKDRLRAWLLHLALNAAPPATHPCESVTIALDGTWRFPPVANAAALLGDLLGLYGSGLRQPLRFFPKASWAFAERSWGPGKTTPEKAMAAAKKAWLDGNSRDGGIPGEGSNPWVELCFRDVNPLCEEWEEATRRVFEPMLQVAV